MPPFNLRRKTPRDANEPDIIEALEGVGASVERLDRPVDLLVGYRGANFLIEVKLPKGPRGGEKDRKLTEDQERFFLRWRGQRRVARTPEDALAIIGAEYR